MTVRSNLTKEECFDLVQFVCDAFRLKNPESAIAAIVEHLRDVFDADCVSIHEVFSRPHSLRCIYETLRDPENKKRVNNILSFTDDVWNHATDKFSAGHNSYRADRPGDEPLLIGPVPITPMCVMQMPMRSGDDFLGVLDVVYFADVREWTEYEIAALNVCANYITHYQYKLSSIYLDDDYDPVTGLLNLHAFTERVDKKLMEVPDNCIMAVIYSDIHHFKYINETYGYKKGDELIKLAAQATKDNLSRYSDVLICHLYADHFVIALVVPETAVHSFAVATHSDNLKVREILQSNCPNVMIHIDTGIYFIKDANITAATAIANANLARKLGKSESIHEPVIFSDKMMEDIKYQEFLNNELPKAIENRQLKVYYQPKINCEDDSLYGAEALVRWQRPDGSFIYPDKFIPIFERNGNITEVDYYVYREVFRYIRERIDKGLPVFPISMNVSRVHLRSNKIVSYIKSLLEEYCVPPELVEFELTENIYMNDFSKADEFVRACRKLGIRVSMDDFGSGYSSLNLISSITIDTLKIDRIFLKNPDLSENDKTVIETMIIMAKRLGMKVICEGVETELQARFLKSVKCDQIQGYYYGRPMDEKSFCLFTEKILAK